MSDLDGAPIGKIIAVIAMVVIGLSWGLVEGLLWLGRLIVEHVYIQ